jgi:hypothetical protein
MDAFENAQVDLDFPPRELDTHVLGRAECDRPFVEGFGSVRAALEELDDPVDVRRTNKCDLQLITHDSRLKHLQLESLPDGKLALRKA